MGEISIFAFIARWNGPGLNDNRRPVGLRVPSGLMAVERSLRINSCTARSSDFFALLRLLRETEVEIEVRGGDYRERGKGEERKG